MSSDVTLYFDKPVSLHEFQAHCEKHGIVYSPQTVGGNVFYKDEVEIKFGGWQADSLEAKAGRIEVGTYWMGDLESVASVALKMLVKWNGKFSCDPELDVLMGHKKLRIEEVEIEVKKGDKYGT